jgi:integrase
VLQKLHTISAHATYNPDRVACQQGLNQLNKVYPHHVCQLDQTRLVGLPAQTTTLAQQPTTILKVLINLKNNGRSNYWIKFADKALKFLSKNVNLNNPQQTKEFIANLQRTNGYKKNLCIAYNNYCEYYKIEWKKPKYQKEAKIRKIPSTNQIETIITHTTNPLKTKLILSKETGLRPIELMRLTLKDISLEERTIYPTTAKNGAPRTLKISKTLQAIIKTQINKIKNPTPNTKIFRGSPQTYGTSYRRMRNNLANKLNDYTLRTVRLYDFRHYFATRLYAKTGEILYVKQQMGHKSIDTTLIYIQLIDKTQEQEYTCKTATTLKEETDLIEHGFEYIHKKDGISIYRKRK